MVCAGRCLGMPPRDRVRAIIYTPSVSGNPAAYTHKKARPRDTQRGACCKDLMKIITPRCRPPHSVVSKVDRCAKACRDPDAPYSSKRCCRSRASSSSVFSPLPLSSYGGPLRHLLRRPVSMNCWAGIIKYCAFEGLLWKLAHELIHPGEDVASEIRPGASRR